MEFGRFPGCSLSFILCILMFNEGMVDAQNLAKYRPANQSSIMLIPEGYGIAANAVDGGKNPEFVYGSCTHTQDVVHTTHEWWEVDLGLTYNVTQINIFNREEQYDCPCNQRLKNFKIKGGIGCGSTICYTDCYTQIDLVGLSKTFDLQNCTARYIQVYKTDHGILTLCEVEVYGEMLPTETILVDSISTDSVSTDYISTDDMSTVNQTETILETSSIIQNMIIPNTHSTEYSTKTTPSESVDTVTIESSYVTHATYSQGIVIEATPTAYESVDTMLTSYIFDMASNVVTTMQTLLSFGPPSNFLVITSSPTDAHESADTIPTTHVSHITTLNSSCSCVCIPVIFYKKTELLDLSKNLTLNVTELSNYRRKKTSAADERPSAMYLGYTGAALLSAILIVLFLADLTTVMHFTFTSANCEKTKIHPIA